MTAVLNKQYILFKWFSLYIVLFLFFLALDRHYGYPFIVFRHLWQDGNIFQALFYAITYLGLVATAMWMMTSQVWFIRYLAYILFGGFIFLFMSYCIVNHYGFELGDAIVMLREINNTNDTAIQFFWQWLPSLVCVIFAICAIAWTAHKLRLYSDTSWSMLGLIFILGMVWIIEASNARISSFPVVFKVPVLIGHAMNVDLYDGERASITMEKLQSPEFDHIIIVWDESIRGDTIGKIHNNIKLMSIADEYPQERTINFGIACSGANCSATSYGMMQAGLRPSQMPDSQQMFLKKPSWYQYAKHAEYHTVLVGFSPIIRSACYVRPNDEKQLDYCYFIPEESNIPKYQYDRHLLDQAIQQMQQHPRTFQVIYKFGAHFPYDYTYPPSATIFKPVMGPYGNNSIIAGQTDKILNSYYNAVQWSSQDFLADLLKRVEGTNTLVVYTSDHGQSFIPGELTHGSYNSIAEQGNVPLLLFVCDEKGAIFLQKYRTRLEQNINHVSHADIFSTLLVWMGYNKEQVTVEYGDTLLDPITKPRQFYYGNIFGNDPFSGFTDFDKKH